MSSGKWKRWFSNIGTTMIVIGLFVVFVVAVMWFRSPKEPEDNPIDSIAHVLRPDPISEVILNGAIDTESKTASLQLVGKNLAVGEARRGDKDGTFFLEVSARLPEIDREVFFYEVWLLRPIPYDFFAVGEMVTNDEGVFVLDWEGEREKDYSGYMRLVITRQEYKGSRDPQVHVVEAEFGK